MHHFSASSRCRQRVWFVYFGLYLNLLWLDSGCNWGIDYLQQVIGGTGFAIFKTHDLDGVKAVQVTKYIALNNTVVCIIYYYFGIALHPKKLRPEVPENYL